MTRKQLLILAIVTGAQTHAFKPVGQKTSPMQMTAQMYLAIHGGANGTLAPLLQQIPQQANAVHGAYNKTSLMHAAANGKSNHVQTLIDFGADLNARDTGGLTALMHAANQPELEPVKILVEAGAEIDCASHSGGTAISMADDNYRTPSPIHRAQQKKMGTKNRKPYLAIAQYLQDQLSLQIATIQSTLIIDCSLLPDIARIIMQYQLENNNDLEHIQAQTNIALKVANQLSGKRKQKKQLTNSAPFKKHKTDANLIKPNLL